MKGLLIKDFKLMKGQRNFYMIIAVIAVAMAVTLENSSFVIAYITFIGAFFTLSTISYDEFDNGNAFLFSLPITKKNYTAEKYEFGLIIGGTSWLFATILTVIIGVIKNSALPEDTLVTALVIIPVFLIMLSCMLPFQFKFGSEKGRIAIIGAVGLVLFVSFGAVKIAGVLHIDLDALIDNLPTVNMGLLIAAASGIAAAALFLSYKISVRIMNRKEF
jgi:ABC-2 type transport system permease protein